ncbi:MAG: TFIIB-type zinc ribbon-containing protein, partial [Planctomycetota bacterium]
KCRFVMDERDQHGITVDVCRGCRGVFFDQGEVDSLISTVKLQDKAGTTSSFISRLFGR